MRTIFFLCGLIHVYSNTKVGAHDIVFYVVQIRFYDSTNVVANHVFFMWFDSQAAGLCTPGHKYYASVARVFYSLASTLVVLVFMFFFQSTFFEFGQLPFLCLISQSILIMYYVYKQFFV